MTPLESAARALYDRCLESPDVAREAATNGPHPTWDQISANAQAKWIDDARTVLQAIREPSEAMIEEAYDSYTADGGSLRDVFMNMIDAALEEG